MTDTLRFQPDDAESPPHLGMAPLVDIVLLLICFYLFVMQSIQSRAEATIDLPAVYHAPAVAAEPAELVLNLDADGTITLNGQTLTLGALPSALTTELARAADQEQQLALVVRADRSQTYGRLDAVLETCREAGLGAVTLRTTQERNR